MATYKVAYVEEKGQRVTIIFVNASVATKDPNQQQALYKAFQHCAGAAGLEGPVILVWSNGRGGCGSFGPRDWQLFVSGQQWDKIIKRANGQLTCS